MSHKSKLYVGLISVIIGVVALVYGVFFEVDSERKRDMYIGSAALIALGVFRLYTYFAKK